MRLMMRSALGSVPKYCGNFARMTCTRLLRSESSCSFPASVSGYRYSGSSYILRRRLCNFPLRRIVETKQRTGACPKRGRRMFADLLSFVRRSLGRRGCTTEGNEFSRGDPKARRRILRNQKSVMARRGRNRIRTTQDTRANDAAPFHRIRIVVPGPNLSPSHSVQHKTGGPLSQAMMDDFSLRASASPRDKSGGLHLYSGGGRIRRQRPQRDGEREKEHERRTVEGCAGKDPWRCGTDEIREDARPDRWTGDGADAVDAGNDALQQALLVRRQRARHQGHRCRLRDDPAEQSQYHDRINHPALRHDSVQDNDNGADEQSEKDGAPLADLRHHDADKATLRHDEGHADHGERKADRAGAPVEAIGGEQDPGRFGNLVGEGGEHEHEDERQHRSVPPDIGQRADRIGTREAEGAAVFNRERLRQHEKAENKVSETEARRDEKRQAQTDVAQKPTDGGTGNEAETEGGADEAETLCAFFRRRDVGEIGGRRRIARAHRACNEAAGDEPGERRRRSQNEVVDAHAEERNQNDRSSAEAIGERTERRGEQKLHQRISRREQAENP